MPKKTLKQRMKTHGRRRKLVQVVSGLLQNAHLSGFLTGTIYQGPLKHFCVPGMNCYSCPGAIGACPIGALQAIGCNDKRKFSFYVFGYLLLIGVMLGRFVCGWLCLFGLIQELLYKIPTPKLKIPEKVDKPLRYLKYVFLILVVLILPVVLKTCNGLVSNPYFCKYVCPVGMLEGGIPLVALDELVRSSVHWLYAWKGLILAVIVLSSIFIYRPFCKYICPLGAFYGLCQKFSFLRLRVDEEKCVNCNACSKMCKMNVDVRHNLNSTECIRCGECTQVCSKGALSFGIRNIPKSESAGEAAAENTQKEGQLV